jgi:hypothetical protein
MLFNQPIDFSPCRVAGPADEKKTARSRNLLRVVGGKSDGLLADARDALGAVSIDPCGIGASERHEIRRIRTRDGSLRVLVLASMSDEQAAEHYLALHERTGGETAAAILASAPSRRAQRGCAQPDDGVVLAAVAGCAMVAIQQ